MGAGGGVGIHTVQVAKVFGAYVIGVDVSDEKLEFAKEHGADEVINVTGKKMAQDRGTCNKHQNHAGCAQRFCNRFDEPLKIDVPS